MVVSHRTRKTLFFAGTDTNVGKTYVAALFAKSMRRLGHRVGVYKPVASGCQRDGETLLAEDAMVLWTAADKPRSLEEVCPQRFEAPLAPPQAAAAEGRQVDSRRLREGARCWEDDSDFLIVEGAGGLLSPMAVDVLNIDLAQQFSSPQLLIVAADRLGVIHQTLATCEAASHRGLLPAGIILCSNSETPDPSSQTNAQQIAYYCDVPLLARVAFGATRLEDSVIDRFVD